MDVILARLPETPENDALARAAPIFYLHHLSFGASSQTGYQAYLENLRILGALTGKPAAAEAAITRFETALANLKKLATPETKALTVARLFSSEAYYGVAPTNPFCVVLAEIELGQCLPAEGNWREINAEQFLALNPDWIADMGDPGSPYSKRTDPVWSQLKAVKAGHVFDATLRATTAVACAP